MALKLGVNLTHPKQIPEFQKMLKDGTVEFVEILIDNFLSCDPLSIRRALGDCEISFHIMRSKFLERDVDELSSLGGLLRSFVQAVGPQYVSDHVALFSTNGLPTQLTSEVDYRQTNRIIENASRWQRMLGHPLLLENFPSHFEGAGEQIKFFSELGSRSGLGMLFDISNAQVADLNGAAVQTDWLPLVRGVRHFHVGGFSKGATSLMAIDSHDRTLDRSSFEFVEQVLRWSGVSEPSLTVEFDHDISYDKWRNDLDVLRKSTACI